MLQIVAEYHVLHVLKLSTFPNFHINFKFVNLKNLMFNIKSMGNYKLSIGYYQYWYYYQLCLPIQKLLSEISI